ncbi:hypothetical protein M378DRAFT_11453 [Amanita muscaria Koide BX008]|uniref:Uncharacterized protein n=1 Tax=Amanita muscaria (strain Koide BX008) TaxID=946122 RepID=A0A0C2X6R8_AMAMK|nr:hypothetical protein M378DRAFT_11453 [Amanita muscaria Koide BX008]
MLTVKAFVYLLRELSSQLYISRRAPPSWQPYPVGDMMSLPGSDDVGATAVLEGSSSDAVVLPLERVSVPEEKGLKPLRLALIKAGPKQLYRPSTG